jgi:dolichol-phosphate mannosyltransferase
VNDTVNGRAIRLPPTIAILTVVVPCYNEHSNIRRLIQKLDVSLTGIAWEVVFVDDDSPDQTAAEVRRVAKQDPRVRCILRKGRRGLASAVIEGALSSSAEYLAVMDADLQHDERRLPDLMTLLRSGEADIVVGSRYLERGHTTGLETAVRQRLSLSGVRLVQSLLPVRITDPMSGFFMLRRDLFERLTPRLTGQGFKILLDLLLSSPTPLRVAEVQVDFFRRAEGDSKLDLLVLFEFLGLIIDKISRGFVPLRFVSFALVGLVGILVNVAVLLAGRSVGLDFVTAQWSGTLVSMVANFQINNIITFRDQRRRGLALWRGLVLFMAVCSVGAFGNVGVSQLLYQSRLDWTAAGALGAAIGVVWNYAMSSTVVWRRH